MPVVSIARHALPPHSAVGGLESTPVANGVHTCCTCARSPCAGTSRSCSYNPLVPTSVPTSSNLATHLPAMQAPLAARHPGRLRHCEPAPARFQAERRARPSVKGSRCSCRSRAQAVGTPPNARPQGEPDMRLRRAPAGRRRLMLESRPSRHTGKAGSIIIGAVITIGAGSIVIGRGTSSYRYLNSKPYLRSMSSTMSFRNAASK